MVQLAVSSKNSHVLTPPETTPILGWYVYLLATSAVIGGFLFGYDTDPLYVKDSPGIKPLSDFWQESIIAITSACASIGALLSGQASDFFGRKKIIVFSSVVFTIGALICASAPTKEVLLVGRIFLGIGIGFSSMIVPVYVSESAPMHIRGQLLTGFNFLVTFGQMASNIVAGCLSYLNPDKVGWRLMFGFAAIPAIIQFIAFLFLPESPRWLYAKRGETDSRKVFKKIFGQNEDWINYHLAEIKAIHDEEESRKMTEKSWIIWKILKTPHIRKALFIGCSLQAFQQLAGINTIMYYAGTIIQAAGIKDNHKTIWISVGTSFMNTIGNVIPFWLIEKVGRKKILLSSAFGVIISLVLMGTSFLLINLGSSKTLDKNQYANFDNGTKNFAHCLNHRNCDYCVTDEKCGFCVLHENTKAYGFCFPVNSDHSDKSSSIGYCSDSYNYTDNIHNFNGSTKFEWMDVYCKTKFTVLPIVIMVVYLSFFSFGFGPIPWVLNAEFYPLWARGTCVSLSTFTNWIFNVIISLTFLSLTEAATKFGAFYIYAGITSLAFFIFWKYIPETKNCSIDEVEMLFMTKEARKKFEKNLEIDRNEKTEKL